MCDSFITRLESSITVSDKPHFQEYKRL